MEIFLEKAKSTDIKNKPIFQNILTNDAIFYELFNECQDNFKIP